MNTDVDLQVWLAAAGTLKPGIVIPYVQSPTNTKLRYELTTTQSSAAGTSTIRQGGDIQLHANEPRAITEMTIHSTDDASCNIQLVFENTEGKEMLYTFSCPN
ncbi:hypothetical protein L1889_06805 [Paenalcaligenes niemegkensis]|uniref:curli-like amyloid fiber formation chaperone CsgH n=1 Tax=Paenalcaligenes niemegkensis TaxID=2895469 RepID=UPI001EE97EAB|nr:curli-like amyloid fiber formation chaperone CsgH [Paenalcaligenes niemegkensis]MCQ9616452.1 hypothetical protein [Paenalcaligenes niemegkensis]